MSHVITLSNKCKNILGKPHIKGLKIIPYSTGVKRFYRVYVPAKKDGTPMVKRSPIVPGNCLEVHPDGGYRYYNKKGTLGRDRTSNAFQKRELSAEMDRLSGISLRDLYASKRTY